MGMGMPPGGQAKVNCCPLAARCQNAVSLQVTRGVSQLMVADHDRARLVPASNWQMLLPTTETPSGLSVPVYWQVSVPKILGSSRRLAVTLVPSMLTVIVA